MIAFGNERRSDRCDSCGYGPCNDGTCCHGGHRYRTIEIDIGPAREFRNILRAQEAIARMSKVVSETISHPRFSNGAPRSPKPGFKKR
jgi:hypothetical protein